MITSKNIHRTAKEDRRASDRFPIEREAMYRLMDGKTVIQTAAARTLDISSGGILFSTELPPNTGDRLEVSVNWPAQLDNNKPLKMVAHGRVVRTYGNVVALAIEKYEFRMQGSRGFQVN